MCSTCDDDDVTYLLQKSRPSVAQRQASSREPLILFAESGVASTRLASEASGTKDRFQLLLERRVGMKMEHFLLMVLCIVVIALSVYAFMQFCPPISDETKKPKASAKISKTKTKKSAQPTKKKARFAEEEEVSEHSDDDSAGEDSNDDSDDETINPAHVTKARLKRLVDRELRKNGRVPYESMLRWMIEETWRTFAFYSALCGTVLYLQFRHGLSVGNDFLRIGAEPLLVSALQFLAAFLVGLGLTDAVSRYKEALSALNHLNESVENLRQTLLAGTVDDKFRIAIQVHISWFMCLLRKKVAFFAEDWEGDPIKVLIPDEFERCKLFKPEVLWAFDRSQAEWMFVSFLANAKLLDKEGLVIKATFDIFKSMTAITNQLVVKDPSTSHYLCRVTVYAFLLAIPIFNEEILTLITLPFVACILSALMELSTEIAEPWGEKMHHLPTDKVLYFLATPKWTHLKKENKIYKGSEDFEDDKEKCRRLIHWLNRGLTRNVWKWRDGERPSSTQETDNVDDVDDDDDDEVIDKLWRPEDLPIPRKKLVGDHKDETVDFKDYRPLHEVLNYDSFDHLIKAKKKDMEAADKRGNRMAAFLCWHKVGEGKSLYGHRSSAVRAWQRDDRVSPREPRKHTDRDHHHHVTPGEPDERQPDERDV